MSDSTSSPKRVTFNSQLKADEQTFKTMQKVLAHIGEHIVGHTFDSLWELVSSKPVDYYKKHFRRENKRTNPLSNIKRPRTAYTFFTKERRNQIQAKNQDKGFGEISKMVSEEWGKLSVKKRAPYVKLEEEDKARYEAAKAEVLAAQPTNVEPDAPVETPAPVEEPSSPPAKKAAKSKSKGGKRAARKQK